MTMKKVLAGLCMAASMAGFSSVALADGSGFYVLGAIGQTQANAKSNTDADLIALGVTGLVSSGDDHLTGYKLQAGYQMDSGLAIEGGYIDYGKFNYTATATNMIGVLTANGKATGWNLVAVSIWPLDNQFSILAKLGVAEVRTSTTVTAPGLSASTSDSKTDVTYGLGVKYEITKAVFLRGDLDSYKGPGGGRNNVWALGVGYKF